MWIKKSFQLTRFFNGCNFFIIEGIWKVGIGVQVTIVNVYCFGSLREKRLIWEEISEYRKNQICKAWCVVEDINSIRRQQEKKSLISVSDYNK